MLVRKEMTAKAWWQLYSANLTRLTWIAERVAEEPERSNLVMALWHAFATFDSSIVRELNRIWRLAPDDPIIHKWHGWGALCDLCEQGPDEFDDRDLIHPYTHYPVLDAQQKFRAKELTELFEGPSVIAGGAVRDYVIRGEPASDIDVFMPRGTEIVCDNLESGLFGDVIIQRSDEHPDYREMCRTKTLKTPVAGTRKIQFIELASQGYSAPIARVTAFDAPCNMILLLSNGLVVTKHPNTMFDIQNKIYGVNDFRSCAPSSERLASFDSRGWRQAQ